MNVNTFIYINIIKGKFATDKNYITKMNPYCVIEVGNLITFRTNIC